MTEVLFIEVAPDQGTEHRLGDGATIGRVECDVTLADQDVSRHHATLRAAGTAVSIEDHGSTNGTFVNDARIKAVTELQDGDHVRFGDVVWELRAPIQATRAVQTVPPERAVSPAAEPARSESRGDVPMPDFAAPRVAPVTPAPSGTPEFSPSGGRFKRSAARRLEATVISYGVVLATAVAIAAYFAQR